MALPTSDIDIEQAYLDIAKMEQGTANVDINDAVKRAEELAGLFPSTRRASIYDLASNISAGLTAQAASGQAPSIGYGFAQGFKMFNDAEAARRNKAEQMKQSLVLKAYGELQDKRQKSIDYRQLAATKALEAEIEARGSSDYFAGSGLENQARNIITTAQIAAAKGDYSLMYDSNGDFLPQYEQARDIINAPKTSYQTSGSTVVPVITTSTIDFERYERKKPNQKAIDFLKTNDTEENRSAFIEKYGALPEGL